MANSSRDGAGTFNREYDWTDDAGNSINITPSRFDEEMDGVASELTNSVAADGQTTMTGALKMGGQKVTNVGTPAALTDAVRIRDLSDNSFRYLGTTSGTTSAYTLSPSPSINANATGQEYSFTANADNTLDTGETTLNISAKGALNFRKISPTGTQIALVAGDIKSGFEYNIINDGTSFILQTGIIPNVVNGGTGIATATAFAPLFAGTTATGAFQAGTPGTAGHQLTSNGASAIATFKAGGSSLVATATASTSSTLTFSSLSAAAKYHFFRINVTISNDGIEAWLRSSTDNGSTVDSGAASYNHSIFGYSDTGTGFQGNASDTEMVWAETVDIASRITGWIMMELHGDASSQTRFEGASFYFQNTSGDYDAQLFHGIRLSAADVDYLEFSLSAGTYVAGTIEHLIVT